jgi:hypothetical protein
LIGAGIFSNHGGRIFICANLIRAAGFVAREAFFVVKGDRADRIAANPRFPFFASRW